LGYNLVGDDTGCTWQNGTDDQLGKEIEGGLDPRLAPLTIPVDKPPYHVLQSGSPAINKGNTTIGGALGQCAVIDQRGHSRKADTRCDIGSFEAASSFKSALSLTAIKSGPDIIEKLGDPVTYTISIINSSLITASNLVITDVIPNGAFYVSGGTKIGNVVSWTANLIPSGSVLAVTFIVTSNQAIVNKFYHVSADEFDGEGFNELGTSLAEPSLSITKDAPTIAGKGKLITYTISVQNNGKGDAIKVVITDVIPVGASFISATDSGNRENDVVKWNLDNVGKEGKLVRVSFAVTATGNITNSSYRVSGYDETSTKIYSATGSIDIVTIVGEQFYLPILLKR
jgi:uncharacterized repeat protein (TIGR01451 family)